MSDINFSMYDAYAFVYDQPWLGPEDTISPLAKTDWLKKMGYTRGWGQ